MTQYRWHFRLKDPQGKDKDPIQGEFFHDADDAPGSSLIREGIQNSLDARTSRDPVLIRILVSGWQNAATRADVEPFFDGLWDHVRARGNGLKSGVIPDDWETCPFIVFEDFDTSGLTGDPEAWALPSDVRNNFYCFFRGEARSSKTGHEIGRWGVGKNVFLKASQMNAVFGLTVQRDTGNQLLMGMNVLKSHFVGDDPFVGDGMYGESVGERKPIMPICDDKVIHRFRKAFDLQRKAGEPGLSLVVPWCDPLLVPESLVKAVITGYFWPIVWGDLHVMVEAGAVKTWLDTGSIRQELERIGGDICSATLPVVTLATWAHELRQDDFVAACRVSPDQIGLSFGESEIQRLRQMFDAGEPIGIRIPFGIREAGNREDTETFLDVFLQNEMNDFPGTPVYVRGGIIIPDVRKRGAGILRGVRSIVVAEHEAIANFLGDAENPAHTDWVTGGNFKGKYVNGSQLLEFIRHVPLDIVKAIKGEGERSSGLSLAEFFSIKASDVAAGVTARASRSSFLPGFEPESPDGMPDPAPRPFLIDWLSGGFRVRMNPAFEEKFEGSLAIRCAYHVRFGSPFKRYDVADFDLAESGPMSVSFDDGTILERKGSVIRVQVTGPKFRLEVTGFDKRRDVRVEVRPEASEDGD